MGIVTGFIGLDIIGPLFSPNNYLYLYIDNLCQLFFNYKNSSKNFPTLRKSQTSL